MSETATNPTSSVRGRGSRRSTPFRSGRARGGGRGGPRKHWDSEPAAAETASQSSAPGLETFVPQAPSAPKSTQPPVVDTPSNAETKSSDKRPSPRKPKAPQGRKAEPETTGSQADTAPPTGKTAEATPTNQNESAPSTDGTADPGGSRGNAPRGRGRGGRARGGPRGRGGNYYRSYADKSVTADASNDITTTDPNTEQDSSSSCSSVVTPIGPHSTLAPFEETPADASLWSGAQPTESGGKQPERVEHVGLELWAEVPPDENIWKTDSNDKAWGVDPAIVETFSPAATLPTRDAPYSPRNQPPRYDTRSHPPREERQSHATRESRFQPPRQETPSTPRPASTESPGLSHTPQPIQPPIDDSPTAMRRVGLAYVLLGPGACVQKVFTDAESPWVMLSGLPPRIRRYRVESLVAPYGTTSYVKVYDPKPDTKYLSTARILFDSHEQARAAVSGLQGQVVGKGPITARLDTSVAGGGLSNRYLPGVASTSGTEVTQSTSLVASDAAATLRNSSVKVSWFSPSSTVYATYANPKFAMERVKDLHGRTFGNRRLNMVPLFSERDQNIKKVARESAGYMVRITGLMGSPDVKALRSFIRTSDIAVNPNYSFENGLTRLRQDLADVAPLESFRLLPHRNDDFKLHAVAQYTTPTAAAAAVKVFEKRRGEYLANSPVWVHRNLTVKYSISTRLAEVLQGEINKLHAWAIDDPDLHVRQQQDPRKPESVQLTLSGNDTKQLVTAKAQLDRALAGVPLTDADGRKIWDQYFTSDEGIAFLESVATSTNICARADKRTNSILLFGPGYARNDASKVLLAELERLQGMRQTLTIPKPVFRRLSVGGLTILRNLVGKGNIYVNVFRQSLTFYGDAQVVRQVQKAIDVMYSEVGSRLQRHSDCVVCLCKPEGGFLLHCGHHYCKECFTQYVASAADNKTLPLVCVGKDCKDPIPLSMITRHANQSDQDELFYAAFQGHVAANPDQYRYCPTPDCQYIYRVGPEDAIVQCRLCLLSICTHCHVEQHENISCADYKASHDESEIQKSFNRWQAAHDVKPCPNCSAPIEKIAGCNHMMCSNCRHHMCWVCLAGFKTSEKVYDHMRAQHGGIGL